MRVSVFKWDRPNHKKHALDLALTLTGIEPELSWENRRALSGAKKIRAPCGTMPPPLPVTPEGGEKDTVSNSWEHAHPRVQGRTGCVRMPPHAYVYRGAKA